MNQNKKCCLCEKEVEEGHDVRKFNDGSVAHEICWEDMQEYTRDSYEDSHYDD